VRKDDRLFTLEVALIGGPVTEEFVDENPVVSRTIEIGGDQTLEDLHYEPATLGGVVASRVSAKPGHAVRLVLIS